ncbi:hypothetical protein COL922a_013660, partial [Colletotrichum nupharicola]
YLNITTTLVSQADADLWLAYDVKLKNTFAQSSTLGDNNRFYIAPLSSAGIAACEDIDSAITNNGLYAIGDSLLSLDEPVFLPSRQSYFQRCLSQEKTAQITTDSFAQWCIQNYPRLTMALNANNAATAVAAAASAAMDGPMASIVGEYQSSLTAADGTSPIPGWHPQCRATFERPAYTIDAQYSQSVDGWIDTHDENSDAIYTENNTIVTKNVTAEEAGSELEVTITATDFQLFLSRPETDKRLVGTRNTSQLAGFPIVANADPNLSKPMAFVNQAILAYGVGMEVKLSSSAASTINNYLEKARSSGGSASMFGFNIGLGDAADSTQTSTITFDQVQNGSSSTGFTIPPSDNAYPTLLGVFGQAIPLPENA